MIRVVYNVYVAYNEPLYAIVDCIQQYMLVPTMSTCPGE